MTQLGGFPLGSSQKKYGILARAVCVRCHGTKFQLLMAFFPLAFFFSAVVRIVKTAYIQNMFNA
jgi:hypothetical protein